jgi:hypothetical protein
VLTVPAILPARDRLLCWPAVGSVRTINTGQVNYAASCPGTGYSVTLAELNSGAICAGGKGIIDPVLSTGKKSGYTFVYAAVLGADGLNDTYTDIATPAGAGHHGPTSVFLGPDGCDSLRPSRCRCDRRQLAVAVSWTTLRKIVCEPPHNLLLGHLQRKQ